MRVDMLDHLDLDLREKTGGDMRSCRICATDITALHFNRKCCHNPRCIAAQRARDNARRNKTTASPNKGQRYATQRSFAGAGNYEVQPLQMCTPKPIRSSGGLNISRDVLDQQRREEWAQLRKGRKA